MVLPPFALRPHGLSTQMFKFFYLITPLFPFKREYCVQSWHKEGANMPIRPCALVGPVTPERWVLPSRPALANLTALIRLPSPATAHEHSREQRANEQTAEQVRTQKAKASSVFLKACFCCCCFFANCPCKCYAKALFTSKIFCKI
jgi:hypothetical protein